MGSREWSSKSSQRETTVALSLSVVISICVFSFLSQFYFPRSRPDSPCCNTVNSSHSLLVAIFHTCFHCTFTAVLGVVFTHTVGYSRPPSTVNDPTVKKQVNSENHRSNKCPNHPSTGCPDQSVLGTSSW